MALVEMATGIQIIKRCHSYIRLVASDIASQLYLGYAQVIFASRVFGANIISLKLQVSISLCVITQNITVRPVSQYHLTFLFLSKKQMETTSLRSVSFF